MKIIIYFGKVLIRKGNLSRMSVKIDGIYSLKVNDKLYIVYNLNVSNNNVASYLRLLNLGLISNPSLPYGSAS